MTAANSEKSLMQVITQIIDTLTNDEKNYDAIVNILSLICLITILNRNKSQPLAINTVTSNPLQKLLGELAKGTDNHSGGPSPDILMSFLPLLNSPQLKSKLNPSNIAAIMSLINGMNGTISNKQDQPKSDKNQKDDNTQDEHPAATTSPKAEITPVAAVTTSIESPVTTTNPDSEETAKKGLGRYLNWKTSF